MRLLKLHNWLKAFFLVGILCNADFADAAQSKQNNTSSREAAIEAEFSCIRNQRQAALDWSDVCVVNTPARSRNGSINEALDQVENKKKPATQYFAPNTAGTQAQVSSEFPEYSDTPRPQRATAPVGRDLRKNQIEFGGEISRISYKEPIFNLEEEGNMYGIYGSYTHHMKKGEPLYTEVINMYKIEAKGSYGVVDYESTPSGTIKDIDDYMIEVRLLLGYDMLPSETTMVTPYAGFGYRNLNDDSSGKRSSRGALGYERSSNYYYLPLGFDLKHQINAGWQIGVNGEFDVLLFGQQKSYLSDVSTSYPDLTNDQKRGYGLRGSVPIIKVGSKFNFVLTPFIRYWNIKDSETSTAVGNGLIFSGYEPKNTSTEFGVKLGVQY